MQFSGLGLVRESVLYSTCHRHVYKVFLSSGDMLRVQVLVRYKCCLLFCGYGECWQIRKSDGGTFLTDVGMAASHTILCPSKARGDFVDIAESASYCTPRPSYEKAFFFLVN